MAHKIENGMIAWKGETPWHGLGVNVLPTATGEEMLKAAKMDWKVQRRALAMRSADGTGLVVDPLTGFKAIVRNDTDEVFQIATNRYHPLQNVEIVNFFKDYCEAGHASMETVGAIEGGKKIFALAKLNGGSTENIGVNGEVDTVKGYMLLASSHDGSLRTIGKPTQVRVVCWNTLSMALGDDYKGASEFRMKHSKKWTAEVAKEAKEVMGMAIESVKATNEISRKLSQVHVDEAGRIEFLSRLLGGESLIEQIVKDSSPATSILDQIVTTSDNMNEDSLNRVGKAILEAMVNSPGSNLDTAKGTLWGVVNGVTYYVDHEKGRTQDSRLSGAWFGLGDRMKRDAMNIAMDMAGIEKVGVN